MFQIIFRVLVLWGRGGGAEIQLGDAKEAPYWFLYGHILYEHESKSHLTAVAEANLREG